MKMFVVFVMSITRLLEAPKDWHSNKGSNKGFIGSNCQTKVKLENQKFLSSAEMVHRSNELIKKSEKREITDGS